MTEVTTRQFIFIALFLIVASKLMSMPTLFFDLAQKDAIFAIIIDFIFEIILVFLICEVIKRNQNTSLFELLKKKFTSVGAFIITFILYAFILIKLFFVLQELYTFFKEFLYDEFEPLIFGIPTFFVIGYLAYKGARTLGRTLEIIFPFILAGLVISILSNVEFLSFDRMLPYFEDGFNPLFKGASQGMFYFGNSLALLFFVGKVKITNHFSKKIVFSSIGLALFITTFCFIFYDVYGQSTIFTIFALSDFAQYDPFIVDIQRVNWLSTTVDITKLFCSASILLYCLGQAGRNLTNLKSTFFPIIVSSIMIILLASISNFDLEILQSYIISFASYITIGIMTLIFIICIIMCVKRSRNEKKFIQ